MYTCTCVTHSNVISRQSRNIENVGLPKRVYQTPKSDDLRVVARRRLNPTLRFKGKNLFRLTRYILRIGVNVTSQQYKKIAID